MPAPCVLHASWVPSDTSGRLLVWAEVVRKTKWLRPGDHPYHLRRSELATVLCNLWPELSAELDLAKRSMKAWIVLPGDGSQPSPSLELQAEREDEVTEPESWTAWRVDVLAAVNPVGLLGRLDFRAATGSGTVRVGQDFEFWQRLANRLAWAVRRHEYLPAIYAEQTVPKRRGKKPRQPVTRFEAGWELAQGAEDDIVETFSRAIPGACRAMWVSVPPITNGEPSMHHPAGIVRHFLATCLEGAIGGTRFPLVSFRRVENSIVELAIERGSTAPASSPSLPSPITETTWAQWVRWRDRIQRSALEADERVCFRLADADPGTPDTWRLEWLLSSRRDPSLLISLADFWARRSLARPSPRSIREVLLQLGQAARIYERLWDGMNSAAPAEVVLGRDEALDFLRHQAAILQGAGFRVIVPAWWTATGQRRLRLRLTTRRLGFRGFRVVRNVRIRHSR